MGSGAHAIWNLSAWGPAPSETISVPGPLRHRVFIMPVDSRFNADVDLPVQMKHGVYQKAERIFHEYLKHSTAVTSSVSRARLFFVPIYVGMLGQSQSGGRSKRSARLDELDEALRALSMTPPHAWPERSHEHVFVVSLDRGRCFQDDVRDRFRNATVLMLEGTEAYPNPSGKPTILACHQGWTDVTIPPAIDVGGARAVMSTVQALAERHVGASSTSKRPGRLSSSSPASSKRADRLSSASPASEHASEHTSEHASEHASPSEPAAAASKFPWAFFTHRRLLAVWRGHLTTQWADHGATAIAHAAASGTASAVTQADTQLAGTTPGPPTGVNVRQQLLQQFGSGGRQHHAPAYGPGSGPVNERVNGSTTSAAAPGPSRTVLLHPAVASSSIRSALLGGAGGEGTQGGMQGGMQGGSAPPRGHAEGLTWRISSMDILVTARKVTLASDLLPLTSCLSPLTSVCHLISGTCGPTRPHMVPWPHTSSCTNECYIMVSAGGPCHALRRDAPSSLLPLSHRMGPVDGTWQVAARTMVQPLACGCASISAQSDTRTYSKQSDAHMPPFCHALVQVRFYESIQMGCVPVTFHPTPNPMPLRMPFERAIDYTALSINVPPNQISELRPRLEAIASNRTRLRDMQRALWQARPAFDWTDLSQAGAFYHTLEQLATKLAHPAGAAERDRALSLRNKPMGR